MKLDDTLKQQIDEMSYEELLHAWRFTKVGSPLFQGDMGTYFGLVMTKKRSEVGQAEHVRISKLIGWG